jgi:hypothetical protein
MEPFPKTESGGIFFFLFYLIRKLHDTNDVNLPYELNQHVTCQDAKKKKKQQT